MPETRIEELDSADAWREAYPVIAQLRPQDEKVFVERMRRMYDERCRLFGLYDGETLVSLAGVRELITLYHGNHAWVYDLVTREDRRSEGFGAEILAYVEDWHANATVKWSNSPPPSTARTPTGSTRRQPATNAPVTRSQRTSGSDAPSDPREGSTRRRTSLLTSANEWADALSKRRLCQSESPTTIIVPSLSLGGSR
jgi:GNAT superfamily N-acetyltransferase